MYNTEEQTIIIISDTHIGSIYENISYLEYVYNYAKKHSIKTILHTGDIIQSTYRNVSPAYTNEETQIRHFLDIYPLDQTIKTNLLFGNHDFHTFNKKPEYQEMLKERKDLTLLGTGNAIIRWQDNLIGLHHHCKKYTIDIPNLETLFIFCGHSHKLSIKDNKIYVPTLSDDLKSSSPPGFLVATITSDTTYIEFISFNEKIVNSKLILTKSL
ncbi:MAG TPA: hypothetical protein DCE23_06405 [Firmicutes bacterium]|nr:hypothetical protein [Bacillota bacterium]